MRSGWRRGLRVALALLASVLLAACLDEPASAPAPSTPAAGQLATPPSRPVATAARSAGAGSRATVTAGPGKTVTIFGALTGEQGRLFQQESDAFTGRTGISVEYEGDKDFEAQIAGRVGGSDEPDIALFAQPDLLAEFVRKGDVVDLNTFMGPDLSQHFAQTLLDAATVDGKMAGIWHSNEVKSLVWYPKKAFDARGYRVPTTWDEMLALSDRIVADGGTPWCIGIESGGATGWVGTDWVEDAMLRTASAEDYDRWTHGDLKFDSPEVKRAFETVGGIWFKEGNVYGGRNGILTTPFGDAPLPMFDNPPGCWLHKQASFIKGYFPESARIGQDVAYFSLPPIGDADQRPVVGWGTIAAMLDDRPEVREVMQFLATGESVEAEVRAGVAVAPHKDADLAWYPDETTRGFARILREATAFRLDGSDLMPGPVGTSAVWTGIVDWVGGADLDAVLKIIDQTNPGQ
jgi:alpha-glucoside transport system substrate-binding protein